MKNVLLLIHDDAGQEARLQAALDLTRALSGHLHCVDVTPEPLTADTPWGMTSGTILYDETQREELHLARLKQRLTDEDVPWTCEARRGGFASCVEAAASSADVVVLNRAIPDNNVDMRTIIGDVLARSEALVLAVPEDARMLDVTGPALVAWDGSKPAMRTIRRAAPLLALACSVTVFQAGHRSEGSISAQDAAVYLARHGIDLVIETSEDAKNPAAQIAQVAERYKATYCVMGAFGHNRLKEAIFGGVTHEMLGMSGLPLLLGH
jgi:nucleotide-binding universal stress UspA family protein